MNALVVRADLASIREIADWLQRNIDASFRPEVAATLMPRMELGLQELAVNIVEHGYDGRAGSIELHFATGEGTVIVDVVDAAPAVSMADLMIDPDTDVDGESAQTLTRVRGYGLSLIHQLTSAFTVDHDGRVNRWRVVFPIPDDAR